MPPNAVPIVATPGNCQAAWTAVATSIATSGAGMRPRPGMRSSRRLPATTIASASTAMPVVAGCSPGSACASAQSFSWKWASAGATGRQAEEILPLAHEDDDGNAGREADDDGVRDEADDAAELQESHREQHHAGHQRRGLQSRDAVLRRDAGEHRDEGAGRAGNLHARAAEDGCRKPGNDRRVQPLLRLGAGGDGEGHRERQRDDADDDARDDVPPDFAPAKQSRLAGFQECDHGEGGNDTPMTLFGRRHR